MHRTQVWALGLVMALGCTPKEHEGDAPGECKDAADNDRDGMFDCLDPDCTGSPDCQDDATPDPTPEDDTDQTPTTDTEEQTDGRQPGPHASEVGLVSAWEQLEETVNSVYGPGCFGLDEADWEDVFAPPTYEGEYVYVFFRLQSGQTTAVGQSCANGFPDGCIDSDVVYLIDGHTLSGALETDNIPVDQVPGCTITVDTVAEVEDMGETGVLNFRISLSSTPSCPADVQRNNSCEFRHEYDLEWVRAE